MSPLRDASSAVKPIDRTSSGLRACAWFFAAAVAMQPWSMAWATATTAPKTFDSPKQAVDALVDAADKDDTAELKAIFGSDGRAIVDTGEPARDKKNAADFVAKAREKEDISIDPKNPDVAQLVVGAEDWPFPVPLEKKNGKWFFNSKAGLREILYRRIGGNELDAIQICHGFVEAQDEYAEMKRTDGGPAQYAQRIVAEPGKQDGLAWKTADGTWAGPVGENIAKVIEQGYGRGEPYHGYYFKVLKGQGPAAPHGRMDYVVKGVMIGGFALVAAPAEYRVTGVKTFMVSNDGVVYEKDLGPTTLEQFKKMELFNPDSSWQPVEQDSGD
jgi:hypothetical protein